MRYIAVFLVLANIAYLAWNLWQGQSDRVPRTSAVAESRPLLNTGLTLVSEYQAQIAEQAARDAVANRLCSLVAGFASIDEANSFMALATEAGLSAQLVLTGDRLPSQYRVYLPPASSRSIATITMDGLGERLVEAGLEVETYLITRGQLENAIALGVFEQEGEAAEVVAAVAELGYSPEIQDIPRSTGDPQVLLDPASQARIDEAEWLDLTAESPALRRSENVCETLVQARQFQ